MELLLAVLSNPIAQAAGVILVIAGFLYIRAAWQWYQEDKNDKMFR